MATNEILTFAGTSTNILTQAEYAADAQRSSGNVPGVARSKLVNKAARQSAFVSSMIGQFIADVGGINVVDDNDVGGLKADFLASLSAFLKSSFKGSAQSLTDIGFQLTPGDLLLKWGYQASAPSANTNITFAQAFPTACLSFIPIGANTGANFQAYVTLNGFTRTGATVNCFAAPGGSVPVLASGSNLVSCTWIAIGY